jgi:hypothetical protein
MKDDKAFVYSGVALLLAIPAVILVAALAGMMEIGDTTTSLVIRSDSVFYPCEDIKGAFEFSANNYATVYEADVNLIKQRFDDRWRPQVTGYFSDAGLNISISTINVSFDSSTASVRVHGKGWFDKINITVTDERGDTKCSAESGPLSIPVGEDEDGPTFFITAPANRTYCDTPPFNITLNYIVSEPAFDVVYSLNGGANQTASVGTNILITASGVNYLTLSGVDGLNNSGSDTVYFYVKQWANVSAYTLIDGNITNFADAQNPSDGGASAEIEELSNTSVLNLPLNREFTTNDAFWTSTTDPDIDNLYDFNTGNPKGSIYSEVDPSGQSSENGSGLWATQFDYDFVNISNANLSFDYMVDKWRNPGSDNWFNITLETPSGSFGLDNGCSVGSGDAIKIKPGDKVGWQSKKCKNLPFGFFLIPGTYYIKIYTYLSAISGGEVRMYFDNIKLDIKTPTGYRYEVIFQTLDNEIINWPDHQLEIRYRMPTNPEGNILSIWNANTSSYNPILGADPLSANTSFNIFTYDAITLDEYNNGNILIKYTDSNPTDTDKSYLDIDYHRVC